MAILTLFASILLHAGSPIRTPPCYSIREAKIRGSYVCSVKVTPSTINWKDKQVVIKEAWLERNQKRGFNAGPLRSRLGNTNGYHLCVNLSKGWDVMRDAWFVLEGQHKGLGAMGTVVLWENLDTIDSANYTILLTDNWKFENAVKIKLTQERLSFTVTADSQARIGK